nr:hypothetical protein [Kibdelosporangium sp. MJ126-NF4]CTQ90862.1 hypothetical protein [Kibdelosporangium sp. MJ126-NF4]
MSTLDRIVDEVSAPAIPDVEVAVVVERNLVEVTVPTGKALTTAEHAFLTSVRAAR